MNKIRNISAVILLLVVSINGSLSAQIKDGQSNAWIKNNSAMDTVITVELDNVTFEEALNAISKESGIIFNYIRDRLPLNQIVSVDMQDVPVSDILAKILNDTNTGLIIASSDFFVIISLEDKYSYGAIKGKVTEEETQKPLSGANIVVRGTSLGTSTNSEGSFTISKLSPGIYVLEASHIGYEKVRLNNILISLGDTVETFFELPEKTASLNEIIITPGYFSLMKNKTTTVNTIRAEQLKNYPQ
ncbi:MAG: carboxypeptidase-like regulatory domain-containing protein, partial [bacterium]|nr:carboxypeptidase-like regulatory domain-containing protein [bacterium]